MFEIFLFLAAIFAGFLGSLLGMGGGFIIVPVLTLGFHVDIRYAVAASLISVVATSSAAAPGFLKGGLTNLRLATFLEVGTVAGALSGFWFSRLIPSSTLFFLFGFFMLFMAYMSFRNRDEILSQNDHPWSHRMRFAGQYRDEKGSLRQYQVEQVPLALFWMYLAGVLSALLGIGSGTLKVLAMDGAMKLPLKVSSATSNLMIGVTAAASAGAYLLQGEIRPEIAAPTAVGIIIGSWWGGRQMRAMNPLLLRKVFVVVLLLVSAQMIWKGFQDV